MRQWMHDKYRSRDQNVGLRHKDQGAKWNRRKDDPHALPREHEQAESKEMIPFGAIDSDYE